MNNHLIRNARVVNNGVIFKADVLIRDGVIERVEADGLGDVRGVEELNANGCYLLPGVIDDQVHFREPGLTHKEDIAHASIAAAAGGVTSFMEMPNTQPQTLTQALLHEKYVLAAASSVVNYSFYMGISNTNLDEALRTDPKTVCGLKAFLGSSTGNMLVDDPATLENLFREAHMLLAIHAEDEATIRANMAKAVQQYGADIPMEQHPVIRNAEACYKSSSNAVALAKAYNTRLHVLHISTAQETELFEPGPIAEKRITAEACVHHLWFTDADYAEKGALIKWNPAVKTAADRDAIRAAVRDGRIDVVATDHAPHTTEEKQQPYIQCPSGAPLIQHSLVTMLELMHQEVFTLEEVVEKLCHAPARSFQVAKRGFVQEGFHADLVLVDLDSPWSVEKHNLLYKCKWSPLEGQRFNSHVLKTWVNGRLVYTENKVDTTVRGKRLTFDR